MGSKVERDQDSSADYNSAEFSAMQLPVVLLVSKQNLQSILCVIPKGREGGRACNNLGRMCDIIMVWY